MLKIYLTGCLCAALAHMFVYFKFEEDVYKSYAKRNGRPVSIGVKVYTFIALSLFAAFFSWISFFYLLRILINIEREENEI